LVKKINIKVITISLLAVLLLSSFSLLFINIFNIFKSNEHESPKAASEWALENGDNGNGKFDEEYNAYSVFTISRFPTLQYFANTVSSGFTYEGKTVKLCTDIDGSGQNFIPIGATFNNNGKLKGGAAFKGTFDGNNKTISNLSTEITNTALGYNEFSLGFFVWLDSGAHIKNLRIQSYKISSPDTKDTLYVGGLAGNIECNSANVTIENCCIENFKLNNRTKNTYLAALFSRVVCRASNIVNVAGTLQTKLIVKNCYVYNIQIEGKGASVYTFGPAEGLISNGKQSNKGIYAVDISGCVIKQISPTYATVLDGPNYGTVNGLNTTANSTTGLNCSSVLTNSDTYTWYYGGPDYNAGYPMLRRLISVKYIMVSGAKDNTISIDGEVKKGDADGCIYLYIPSNAKVNVFGEATQKEYCLSESFMLYNRTISIEANSCSNFTRWVCDPRQNGSIYGFYYPETTAKIMRIKFIGNDNTDQKTDSEVFELSCGDTITVSKTENSVTFSFYISFLEEKEITYEVDPAYLITGAYFTNGETPTDFDFRPFHTINVIHNHDNDGVIEIHVTTELKKYVVGFG